MPALQFITGSVACFSTFIYVATTGKFSPLERRDRILLGLGLVAVFVWWEFRSAAGGNLIALVAFLISFKPTFDGVSKDPFKETPLPWVLWTLACCITTANVIVLRKDLIMWVTPVVLALCHGAIAELGSNERRLQFFETIGIKEDP